MYGLDVQIKQIRVNQELESWQMVELVLKRVASMYEMQWMDLWPSGRCEVTQHNARKIAAHALYRYYNDGFIAEMFGVTIVYAKILHFRGMDICAKDPIAQAVINSIHHDIKYGVICT